MGQYSGIGFREKSNLGYRLARYVSLHPTEQNDQSSPAANLLSRFSYLTLHSIQYIFHTFYSQPIQYYRLFSEK